MIQKTAIMHSQGPGKKGRGQVSTKSGVLTAKRHCPLSKALFAVADISLQAKLERSTA